MDETVRLMRKQLFWSRLTALLFAVMTVLLVIALILTIPVSILAMRLAERVLNKQTDGLVTLGRK